MTLKIQKKYLNKILALFLMFGFVLTNQKIIRAEDITEQPAEINLTEAEKETSGKLEGDQKNIENEAFLGPIVQEDISVEDEQVFLGPDEIISENEITVEEPQKEEVYIPEKEEKYIPKKVYLEPTRKFNKETNFNPNAEHKCFSEVFNIDMSNKDNMTVAMSFEKDIDSVYEIEVGSLPGGIDIKFSNDSYIKTLSGNESSTLFKIKNSPNSNKGNYNISFIFTKKNEVQSSSVCQVNIVNN